MHIRIGLIIKGDCQRKQAPNKTTDLDKGIPCLLQPLAAPPYTTGLQDLFRASSQAGLTSREGVTAPGSL